MDLESNSDLDTALLRVCKNCGLGVLSPSEPERFKNCLACRAGKRATKGSSNRKTSASSSTALAGGKQKKARELKNLEGKVKMAATKTALANGANISSPVKGGAGRKKRGVQVFKSPGDLYEELRSEGMDAHDGRYLLEFHGCFESVLEAGMVDNKEQVKNVARELVKIDLLFEEFVSQGRSYSQVDGSSHSTVYSCSCQPRRDDCCGQIKVTAETAKVYDNGVACQKTTVRVYHR